MYSDIIRKTVYGKDMRKPIADSCEAVRKKHQDRDITVKKIISVDIEEIQDETDDYVLNLRS